MAAYRRFGYALRAATSTSPHQAWASTRGFAGTRHTCKMWRIHQLSPSAVATEYRPRLALRVEYRVRLSNSSGVDGDARS